MTAKTQGHSVRAAVEGDYLRAEREEWQAAVAKWSGAYKEQLRETDSLRAENARLRAVLARVEIETRAGGQMTLIEVNELVRSPLSASKEGQP